ncbi:MAG: Zn-dependent alcohol dehydrogenase [Acidimicrobiia bacterium]|nr:Zn-dependent alcohol dehydrogenase [Acidimicrobiia bacterium]
MKGIIYDGETAGVREGLETKEVGPAEVKVEMVAAGVCHSDLSVIDGTIKWQAPAVLGHEGAGIISEVGSEVDSLEPGDHVVLSTLASCGHCEWCSSGHPTFCRSSIGNMRHAFTLDGEPTWDFAATSVFAQETVVRAIQAVKIPDDVPLESACLIGCGVITGVGTVFNKTPVEPGQAAAVFGVGGIGLNVIQALRIKGAAPIIAVDTNPSKEALARQFGATHFIDASEGGGVEAVRAALPTEENVIAQFMGAGGVAYSYDCVGHPAVVSDAVDVLDWGGLCVVVGVPGPDARLDIPINKLNLVERAITGCRYGSSRPHHDIPQLIGLYRSGQLLLDELVTETYPLEAFDQVVHDMHEGRLARGVLKF